MSSNSDLHKLIHRKPKPPRYEPITVAEALRRLHLYLHTVIELGAYAFLSSDREASKHIIDLEAIVDEVAYQLLLHMSLAVGHDITGAPYATPIYMYVFGVDKIMDSFKDLASLVLRGLAPSPKIYRGLVAVSDVVVARLPGDRVDGVSIRELCSSYAIEVLALLRRGKWILEPSREVVASTDIVYVKGFKENVNELLTSVGLRPVPEEPPSASLANVLRQVDSMIDMLLVFNDLAHYQLKAQDPKLAEELLEMEVFFDDLRIEVSRSIIGLGAIGADDRFSLLTLVTRLEDVSDSLTYIIGLPAEEEYRDVLSGLVEAEEERISVFKAARRVKLSELADKLEDLGASILAVRRDSEWIAVTPYNISKLECRPGDSILVSYSRTLEDYVVKLLEENGLARV